MKVTRCNNEFLPFDLILSIESNEEAKAIYAIFSHTNNTKLLDNEFHYSITEALSEFDTKWKNVIAKGVTTDEFYK